MEGDSCSLSQTLIRNLEPFICLLTISGNQCCERNGKYRLIIRFILLEGCMMNRKSLGMEEDEVSSSFCVIEDSTLR